MNDEMMDKIDVMVHVSVMGYTYQPDRNNGKLRWHDPQGNPLAIGHEPARYTRDWSAMGEVLTKMSDELPDLAWRCGDSEPFDKMRWWCYFRRGSTTGRDCHGAAADTMPLAVALAALKAVGVDVREFEEVK